jgi:hypothetical protein
VLIAGSRQQAAESIKQNIQYLLLAELAQYHRRPSWRQLRRDNSSGYLSLETTISCFLSEDFNNGAPCWEEIPLGAEDRKWVFRRHLLRYKYDHRRGGRYQARISEDQASPALVREQDLSHSPWWM